jgi:hypothetical protein
MARSVQIKQLLSDKARAEFLNFSYRYRRLERPFSKIKLSLSMYGKE